MSIVISLLYLLLNNGVIILVDCPDLVGLEILGQAVDPMVLKAGQFIVAILILIMTSPGWLVPCLPMECPGGLAVRP